MWNKEIRNQAESLLNSGLSTKAVSLKTGISQRVLQRWNKKKINITHNKYDLKGCKWLNKPSKPGIIGVIGDMHQPFTDKDYLQFLINTFREWNVDTVVNIGDSVDLSTLSRHISEADAYGVKDELEMAKENLRDYYDVFPYMKCCLGNHPQRLIQRASDSGIPAVCIKSLEELFDIPKTWEIGETWTLNGVLFTHGTQFNSRNILTTVSSYTDKSICVGHQHSLLGVVYNRNLFNKESFALAVGCGIDESKYAFRYGKNNKMKPVLGCGIVINSEEAYAIRMTKK